jgi:hypothetical protein
MAGSTFRTIRHSGALGDRAEPMLRDVERRLAPFSRNGAITEAVLTVAQVAKR